MNHRLLVGLAVFGAVAIAKHRHHGPHHVHLHAETERHGRHRRHHHGPPCHGGTDLRADRWTGLTEDEARERLVDELGDDTDAVEAALDRLRTEGRLADAAPTAGATS